MKRLHYNEQITTGGVDINLSPLIDVVFLLLIFFIVTAVFVEETGVEVSPPRAASAVALEQQSMLLALTAEGEIVYGGRRLSLNAVRGLVARQMSIRPVPVILKGDQAAPLGALVDLLDECTLGGAEQVSIATEREAAP